MTLSRRGFLSGLVSTLAAPAIVHAGNLMPVKVMRPLLDGEGGYLVPTEFVHEIIRLSGFGDGMDGEWGVTWDGHGVGHLHRPLTRQA